MRYMRSQLILLVCIILAAVALTRLPFFGMWNPSGGATVATVATSSEPGTASSTPPHDPVRNWNVLDPQVAAQAMIVQSLDDGFPYFRYRMDTPWPLASLTKLLTSVVVVEQIGLNQKIPISKAAVDTEGAAGDLWPGEEYAARDLLKIMLMASSNDAAAAFEEYIGKDKFLHLAREKERGIGMTGTRIYDASGLDDSNTTTARDMFLLLKYLVAHHPDILSWTRLTSLIVQPLNTDRSHIVSNIDALSSRPDFLGGKTGTSPKAQENFAGIFSFHNARTALVILGTPDRVKETDNMLKWINSAYTFGN